MQKSVYETHTNVLESDCVFNNVATGITYTGI